MGLGIAASKTPKPNAARLKSIASHGAHLRLDRCRRGVLLLRRPPRRPQLKRTPLDSCAYRRAPRLMQRRFGLVTKRRKVIVHIATSADGYIARSDGDLEWLTSRPAPKGFYGMNAFMRSVDTKVLGRKTYDVSLRLGAKFDSQSRNIVFSGHPPPADAPSGVEFVNDAIGPFVSRLREQPGKDIWLMGGGEIIASFLDAQAIDEFVISVAPVFTGDAIPLIARRHRHVPLDLHSIDRFEDGVVQLHYRVQKQP